MLGEEGIAEFGTQVAADHSGTGRIAVSSPASGSGYWNMGLRSGSVQVFSSASLKAAMASPEFTQDGVPFLKSSDLQSETTFHGAMGGLRLGYLGHLVKFTTTGSLMIGAPMRNNYAKLDWPLWRQAGALYVWSKAGLPRGTVVDIPTSATMTLEGQGLRHRLGTSIEDLGDGHFAVGLPMLDNGEKLMAGGVGVFTFEA